VLQAISATAGLATSKNNSDHLFTYLYLSQNSYNYHSKNDIPQAHFSSAERQETIRLKQVSITSFKYNKIKMNHFILCRIQ